VPGAIVPAAIDETPGKQEAPRDHALRLAIAKAKAVRGAWIGPPAIVLAADTVVACGRRILPKASTNDEVRDCLALLSGRRHQVITAVAIVIDGAPPRSRVAMTRVSFARLSDADIQSYLECGEGIGKAGGYAIQGRAETFVRQLNGSYSNVVGLPLFETIALLKGCGLSIP
jgi:septum formation protein